MTLRLAVIINPHANHGRAVKSIDDVRLLLRAAGCEPAIFVTEKSGDATEFARRCVAEQTWDGVVAVGGDGTVNEVVNGVWNSDLPLSFIPLGTGNDFVKMLNLKPNDIPAAVERIVHGSVQSIDVGTVNDRAFVNGVGMGIDAQIAIAGQGIKYLTGLAVYVAALFKVMATFKSPHVQITTDQASFSGRKILVTIGNGQSHGGGFYVTPNASITDGVFDLCVADEVGIFKILTIFPQVIKGTHTNLREIRMSKVTTLHLTSQQGVPVHYDGEILGTNVHEIMIKMHPKALKIRC